MIAIDIEGGETIAKPKNMKDDECSSIKAIHGVDEAGYPYFLTAWKPSYEDIQAFNRGESVYVKTICRQLPPMLLFTMDENNQINL